MTPVLQPGIWSLTQKVWAQFVSPPSALSERYRYVVPNGKCAYIHSAHYLMVASTPIPATAGLAIQIGPFFIDWDYLPGNGTVRCEGNTGVIGLTVPESYNAIRVIAENNSAITVEFYVSFNIYESI